MNIKNRITRLEKENGTDGICNCRGTLKSETYTQDLTDDSDDRERQLMGESVPDVCERCRKPIAKQVSVIQLIDLKKPDALSPRFER